MKKLIFASLILFTLASCSKEPAALRLSNGVWYNQTGTLQLTIKEYRDNEIAIINQVDGKIIFIAGGETETFTIVSVTGNNATIQDYTGAIIYITKR